jgi:hypothetical protein
MKQNSSTIELRVAADSGATVSPQLPMIAVVLPYEGSGSALVSHHIEPSRCVCDSMNPGATMAPRASITASSAPTERSRPTSTICPARMRTSAARPAAPVPSTTVPPRINRAVRGSLASSCCIDPPRCFDCTFDLPSAVVTTMIAQPRMSRDVYARSTSTPRVGRYGFHFFRLGIGPLRPTKRR